ncbi:MAG: 50S ribosomal protein L17 [Endomicrobium sp.]|jgi:large subunit ribosomal protein L17|nr:50S ribosomal protein L17 [Endomicrobium sp.]
MIKTHNGSKLHISSSHKKSLMRNLSTSLFWYESIITTLPRAKELIKYSEKLITKAKTNNLHTIRLVAKELNNKTVLNKLFKVLGPRYNTRHGGYMKIVKIYSRRGDAAKMAVISLLN